jgi:hypothetical protein
MPVLAERPKAKRINREASAAKIRGRSIRQGPEFLGGMMRQHFAIDGR